MEGDHSHWKNIRSQKKKSRELNGQRNKRNKKIIIWKTIEGAKEYKKNKMENNLMGKGIQEIIIWKLSNGKGNTRKNDMENN